MQRTDQVRQVRTLLRDSEEPAPGPGDRRAVVVRLLPKGRRVVDAIDRRNDAFSGALLGSMSAEERRTMLEGLRILTRGVHELGKRRGG